MSKGDSDPESFMVRFENSRARLSGCSLPLVLGVPDRRLCVSVGRRWEEGDTATVDQGAAQT